MPRKRGSSRRTTRKAPSRARGSKGRPKKKVVRYRSAVNGHYVSEHYAKRHPKTTIRETR